MKPLIGHSKSLKTLPDPLPPVVLITGPAGVGKSLFADHLSQGTSELDLQRLHKVGKPEARSIAVHHATAPLNSSHRVTVADITRATPEALNTILKLAEEPPEYSRLIFHHDGIAPATLRSRCFTLHFTLLEDSEVSEILESEGVPEHVLAEAVSYGQGSVERALEYSAQYASRKAVEAVLLAVYQNAHLKAHHLMGEALKSGKGDTYSTAQARHQVVATLFRKSIRTSLTHNSAHALSEVPPHLRMEALRILETRARPHLRAMAALATLAGNS